MGCSPGLVDGGGACEKTDDCAKGLWCLGRVCQKAPELNDAGAFHGDGGRDVGTDTGLDANWTDAETDGGGDASGEDGAQDVGFDTGADVGADAGVDSGPSCGPSPSGKGGAMCEVPAGPFMMGCNVAVDSECQGAEKPYHQVTVPRFKIDELDVTASEYKACVDAAGCTDAHTGGHCTWGVAGEEGNPINCVDWNQAKAYCAWAGKRLPTEAEWEKGARGTDGRKYPWGNDLLDCDHAVMPSCGTGGTVPVGSKPLGASPCGALDMVGNVWQWLEDDWHDDYYGAPTDGSAWTGSPRGQYRVVRGGSWFQGNTAYFRASFRVFNDPTGWNDYFGFRCASSSQ